MRGGSAFELPESACTSAPTHEAFLLFLIEYSLKNRHVRIFAPTKPEPKFLA